jgi:5-methylcytosine-specific restriction endonuclease McrA
MNAEKRSGDRLERIVAEARRQAEQREQGYRAKALKMYPWVCGRCAREFTRENLSELTVHHRDHDHDNNPPGGSNWELLCVYCHDNEHSRYIDHVRGAGYGPEPTSDEATHRPFAGLDSLLKGRD